MIQKSTGNPHVRVIGVVVEEVVEQGGLRGIAKPIKVVQVGETLRETVKEVLGCLIGVARSHVGEVVVLVRRQVIEMVERLAGEVILEAVLLVLRQVVVGRALLQLGLKIVAHDLALFCRRMIFLEVLIRPETKT